MARTAYVFTPFEAPDQTPFERLLEVFNELITHTSGDVDEALEWLEIIDKEYRLSTEDYTLEDFVEDLKKKGYIREEPKTQGPGKLSITAKTERALRKNVMDQLFGNIRKNG